MKGTLRLIAGAVFALTSAVVQAQQWPAKPVTMVNPFAPGGGVDAFGRPLSVYLSKTLGQQFIVENLAGAGGTIGAANAARRAPDGYNFFLGAVHHTIAESLYAKLPYSLEKDFVPITVLAYVPNVVVVHPKHANTLKSLKDLIAYAKANPGKISYGSSGNGSAVHLSTELLKILTGTRMVHIPYRGSAAAFTDLLGGQIHLFMDAAQGLIAPGKAGKVRLIGVASEKRLPALPEVPTFVEQGIQGFVASTWAGVLAPAGTPAPIVKRMADEIAAIVRMDDVRARLDAMGTIPAGSSPAEFRAFIDAETAKWGKVIREAHVSLD